MRIGFKSPPVQRLRRLLARSSERRERGLFVVEGPTSTAEAVACGWSVVEQFVDDERVAVADAGDVHLVAGDVLGRLGSTRAPQPPLAIVEMRAYPEQVLDDASLVVVLDRIADPGNAGTVVRSAEAAGADAVVVTPGSVDPFNPKTVRAAAGSLFHLPVIERSLDEVAAAGLALVGTSSHDRPDRTVETHLDSDLTGRIALVMGNEAAGLPGDWNDEVGPIDRWVTIPHRGRTESLNVAMATTVLLFEAARQRGVS